MSDKELFEAVVNKLAEEYKLNIKRPFNDGYMEISKNGSTVCEMNSDGYNLLANLRLLTEQLSYELE